jgi:hypothetical protein
VEIEVFGPGEGENKFHVKTVRTNPAKSGVVTGNATYSSFLSSMLGKYHIVSQVHTVKILEDDPFSPGPISTIFERSFLMKESVNLKNVNEKSYVSKFSRAVSLSLYN